MKKSVYILTVAALALSFLALSSCKKNPSVSASFSTDNDQYQILEPVGIIDESTAIATSIALRKWEWEDQVSYQDVPDITFKTVGEKTITLTVWPEEGVAPGSTCTRTVAVFNNNEPPVAAFDAPASATQDSPMTFTDRSTDNTGRIVSWLWDIAGITSTEQNPTVTFISWGDNLDVTLTVTDNYGASSSITKKINIAKSTGHDLSVAWTKSYDTKGHVYWTSPAMSPDGSLIYVSSTGYHLVCFDASGNQVGSYNIGEMGANPYSYTSATSYTLNNQSPTPSVGPDGCVYIPVQFYENPTKAPEGTTGNGGLFCIEPRCAGKKWYFPTGEKSTYRFVVSPVWSNYVAITLKENDTALLSQNFAVINRTTGELVQALTCDQGSFGGISVASDQTIIYGASRSGAGYKVAPGGGGAWSPSANSDAGRLTNLLNGTGYDTKGFQIAISRDNRVYVCVSANSSADMVCACYNLGSYTPGKSPSALWTQTVTCKTYQSGFGAVLDDAGNAYFMSGNKVFRLDRNTGAVKWTFDLTNDGGGNGVAAIDSKGYLYVCDVNGNRVLKLSSASGQLVSEVTVNMPKSCPTIAPDGSIYVTGNSADNKPTLYKIVGTGANKTTAPGSNWSQLGCNPQKNGNAPAN